MDVPVTPGVHQARHSGESAEQAENHCAGSAGLFRRTCGD